MASLIIWFLVLRFAVVTSILFPKSRYMDQMIREGIEIELHLNKMSREGGLCLNWSWRTLIHSLKSHRNPLPQK
jgi:hypothetical protein